MNVLADAALAVPVVVRHDRALHPLPPGDDTDSDSASDRDDPEPLHSPLHGRLTTEQRWSVVALKKDGRSFTYIAASLKCNRNTNN